MPMDMKEMIARAAAELMMDGNTRKLTVTDIVDKCQITRQTFYYHFDGIPQMIEWIFQKRLDQLIDETWTMDDPEAGIRSFFIMALNAAPYISRSMQSNYRDELDRLIAERTAADAAIEFARSGDIGQVMTRFNPAHESK